jgi:hypothetical protein
VLIFSQNGKDPDCVVAVDLAQDIMEMLIDAPEEGDGIYEVYGSPQDAVVHNEAEVIDLESMGIDPGLEAETEARDLASPVEQEESLYTRAVGKRK